MFYNLNSEKSWGQYFRRRGKLYTVGECVEKLSYKLDKDRKLAQLSIENVKAEIKTFLERQLEASVRVKENELSQLKVNLFLFLPFHSLYFEFYGFLWYSDVGRNIYL